MKCTVMNIINTFTTLDEMMQGNGPIMLMSPKEMFEMGQFYEWAKQFLNTDELDVTVELPDDLNWVVGETQSW